MYLKQYSIAFFLSLSLIIGNNTFADPAQVSEVFMLREGASPALSGDGRWVAFECNSRNALCLGDTVTQTTEVLYEVPVPKIIGGDILQHVTISRDGMVIAFWYRPERPSDEDLLVYDRNTSTLESVFVNSDEERARFGSGFAQNPSEPSLSGNGRYVLYSTNADNFDPNDTNDRQDLYIRDRQLGTTTRIGTPNGGGQADGNNGEWGDPSTLSADGTKAVFYSKAENLTSGDINDDEEPYEYDYEDAFYIDIPSGLIRRMSQVPGSFVGSDGGAKNPTLSPDGSKAAFHTSAGNLGPAPVSLSSESELFIWDPADGSLTFINPPAFGDPQYDSSLNNTPMSFNYDGSILYFASRQDNLVFGDGPDLIPNPIDPENPYERPTSDIFAYQDGSLTLVRPMIDGVQVGDTRPSSNDLGDIIAFEHYVRNESGSVVSTDIGIMKRGDVTGPTVLALQRVPDGDVGQGVLMDLIGLASDVNRGNADIASAEYQVDAGSWMPFPAKDGTFDNELEELRAFLDTAPLSLGTHSVCARATDIAGVAGRKSCLDFEVVAVAEPEDFSLVCTHKPLWPQPGETVEIRSNSRQLDPFDGSTAFSPVERLEIWYNDQSDPVEVNDYYGTSSADYTTEPLSEGEFYYGCRAILGGKAVFSGWRKVQVGSPDPTAPIAAMYTGPTSDRIDIVFVADEDTYEGSSDPDFLQHIEDIINTGLYRYPLYNRFQHLFNFWISRNTGAAGRESSDGDAEKTVVKPSDWDENYAFADAGAIIHQDKFRDFAKNGMFTFEPGSFRTFRHEVGHRPFGLSDEYCCDTGYFEAEIFPNVYKTLNSCEADAPNLGRAPNQCRSWTSGLNDKNYFTSEPDGDDLMKNNTTPNQADLRRIEWKFAQCLAGLC